VAKDEASAYEGGATRRWLKVKVPGLDRQRKQLAAWNLIGLLTPKPGSGPGSTVNRPTWVSQSAGPDGSPYLATIWSLILS
jgi:hypothetical protein